MTICPHYRETWSGYYVSVPDLQSSPSPPHPTHTHRLRAVCVQRSRLLSGLVREPHRPVTSRRSAVAYKGSASQSTALQLVTSPTRHHESRTVGCAAVRPAGRQRWPLKVGSVAITKVLAEDAAEGGQRSPGKLQGPSGHRRGQG